MGHRTRYQFPRRKKPRAPRRRKPLAGRESSQSWELLCLCVFLFLAAFTAVFVACIGPVLGH